MRFLRRLPWYVAAPAFIVLAAGGIAANSYFTGPLFHETCKNERNLLTGEFEESNCGEGAKVAARTEDPAATPRTSSTVPPNAASPAAANATATAASNAGAPGVIARGAFRDGEPGHQGSGAAELQRLADGKLNLFLSNFSVTNGPDLVVVLSADPEGSRGSVSSGLTLDKLKANNGNQNYAIPDGTNLDSFKSVIIYCKSFPTVFAYATLEASQ